MPLVPMVLWCLLFGHQPVVAQTTAEDVLAVYPVTSGNSHSPEHPLSKILVVSPQAGRSVEAALAAARDVLRRGGLTVLDRSTSGQIPERQGPNPGTGSHLDAEWLTLGATAGADHVVIVEVTDTLILETKATSRSYLHHEQVSVRGIGTERGTLAFEGAAHWSQPMERAGEHVRELTIYAIARAICAPDKWVEPSAFNQGRGRCRAQ